ncbi:hypothetical protein [Sphingomonas xinjiangensis]|uniref:Uncharacterized protein n=1 Tax=Sphingomonas xinjiangensis TaxID=643568 RepID=A0A840YQI2_9SPHN|nr:hypothetical protein [Sphingomonas xinjiangensis]MBB5711221.1 hypothetical protein [Sphingomonas xinjiangensis]
MLYFPKRRYRIIDTLKLRSDTALIALHPSLTHLYLPDETPAYMGRQPQGCYSRAPRAATPSCMGSACGPGAG